MLRRVLFSGLDSALAAEDSRSCGFDVSFVKGCTSKGLLFATEMAVIATDRAGPHPGIGGVDDRSVEEFASCRDL